MSMKTKKKSAGRERSIVVTVRVVRHGHSARVVSAEVTSGPPHVRRFHSGTLAQIVESLSAEGYGYRVRSAIEDVSMVDWYAHADPSVLDAPLAENRARGAAPVPDFADRYMFTTARGGRVYGYRQMFSAALRQVRRSALPIDGRMMRYADPLVLRALVEEALRDDALMRRHAGEVPARVAEAIEDYVWERLRAGGAS